MTADPARVTPAESEAWLREGSSYLLADMLAALIARAPFTFQTMNMLDAIGICRPALTRDAIALARRIGKADVAHGGTCCVTPDPVG